jgi:DNA-binding response OmpR family regulator
MKVLLVENDLDQLDITAYMLRRERFGVVEASDAEQALLRFKGERPDLVVLELGLPPPGGIEVLRRIRGESETPVLVITERDDRPEILQCLELGADDFISKPFIFKELALRVRAILRRTNGSVRSNGSVRVPTDSPLELGDLHLDPEVHEVTQGPHVTRLTPTEYRIFHALVESAGHVVPTNRLFGYVMGGDTTSANSLRSHICHLRKKLRLDGDGRGSIASVPAVGYILRLAPSGGAGSSALTSETAAPGP